MISSSLKTKLTPQEYYIHERASETKHDFLNGILIDDKPRTTRRSLVCINLAAELSRQLKGKRCCAYDSHQRLRSKATGLRCYPDATVYCGPLDYDQDDDQAETATNPTVVFEVLSKSTEAYDRGIKAESYRGIDTLRAYVLISQERPHVELQERLDDGTWRLSWASGLDGVLRLPSIGVEVPLAELYDRVEFSEETPVIGS